MLTEIYEQWRTRAATEAAQISNAFYPPLLVRLPDDWGSARHRIAYVGQETLGWQWTKAAAEEYGYMWDDGRDVISLSDFINYDHSITALIECYRQFDFAALQPHYHSPFWRYFRQVKKTLGAGGDTVSAIFSNVIRCAANSHNGFTLWSISEADRQGYLQWQKGLLQAELAAINPTLIIFVNGPNYDSYLSSEFQKLSFEPLDSFSVRAVAKLKSPTLTAPTYRTYHPNYLNYSTGFAPVAAVLADAIRT
jgi:hypothetical protein